MSEQRYYFGIPFEVRTSKEDEPKFKVGDRVRVIDDAGGGKLGDVCTVTSVNSEDYDSEDGQYYQLDGVTEVEGLYGKRLEPFSPPFAIGDRVRVTKDGWAVAGSWHCADVGFVDTVVGFDRNEGRDRVEGEEWFYLPDEIELAGAPFAAGDRVKLKRHFGPHACGDTGRVREMIYKAGFTNTGVAMDPLGVYTVFPAECLESVGAADCAERKEQPETTLGDILALAPKPKFKAGDWVRCLKDCEPGQQFTKGRTYLVREYPTCSGTVGVEYDDKGSRTNGWDERHFELTSGPVAQAFHSDITQPAIVALVKDGQPRPSNIPYMHASSADALLEAERLAKNNPGQEFAVYQRVGARVCETTYNMKEVA